MNIDNAHSAFNLRLVTASGNEVIIKPPLQVYSDGSQRPLAPTMKIGSVNASLTGAKVSAVSGESGIVYFLPVESFSWIVPSAKSRKPATTAAGKFKESLKSK